MKKTIFRMIAGLAAFGAVAAHAQDEPVTEITITTDKAQFLYDVKEFTVKAGTTVKVILTAPADAVPQPHNIVFCHPGKEAAVTQAAMQLMADPQGLAKGYIPETEDVLAASTLINPGETVEVDVEIPAVAGDYPYLCTFPGHFAIMKGVMKVVE